MTTTPLSPAATHAVHVLTRFGFFLSMISDGDAFMSKLGAPIPVFAEVDPSGLVNGEPLRTYLSHFTN